MGIGAEPPGVGWTVWQNYARNASSSASHWYSEYDQQRLASRLDKSAFTIPVWFRLIRWSVDMLGQGCTVGHGVIVNASAEVGDHCILNSRSLIEHDVKVGEHCHISTGVILNGGVRIGSGSFIGSGAILREGLNLPEHTVIGAGKRIMGWPLRNQDE